MITHPNDHRAYRQITLPNGLDVVLVEDAKATNDAAALVVNIGHFDDPKPLFGLSHLLEHMLFLGSDSFPVDPSISEFISQAGGSINAWTGTEQSQYHFDAKREYFVSCLERFADMLQRPRLDEVLIEKEKLSIDAEFKAKRRDDLRRLYQVHKETCNPKHPFSQFSVGNLETLNQVSLSELRSALAGLHGQLFVAQNCKLSIVSHLTLDQQQILVERLFRDFSEQADQRLPLQHPLYSEKQLGIFINVEPLTQACRLIVSFALPEVNSQYKTKPTVFLSHLLGDEGKGSLLSFLRTKGWVNKLSAGGGISGSNFKDFNINFQLTALGTEHVEQIIESLFSFIRLVESQGVEAWRFEEKKQLSELIFHTLEPLSSIKTATLIATNMHSYSADELLVGDYLFQAFNPHAVTDLLSYFTPENMRVKQIWPGIETDQLASFYHTQFAVKPISTRFIEQWKNAALNSEHKLPEKNPYLSQRKEPLPLEVREALPKKLVELPHFIAWHHQEALFPSIKGSIHLALSCSEIAETARATAIKKLFIALLRDAVNELNYAAEVVGLGYDIYSTQSGLTIKTSGFCEGQWRLLEQLIDAMYHLEFTESRFNQLKLLVGNSWKNKQKNKPLNILFSQLATVFQQGQYDSQELYAELETVDYDELMQFRHCCLANLHCEIFVHGDWQQSDSAKYLSDIRLILERNSSPAPENTQQTFNIGDSGPWWRKVATEHADAALVFYFQGQHADNVEVAKYILIEQIISAPFFQQMRAEKQLGYLVGTGYSPINQLPGIALYIQSPNVSVSDLKSEIEGFLRELIEQMEHIPDEMLTQLKASMTHQLAQKDTSMAVRNQRLWLAIANKDYHFSQQQALVDAINQVSLTQLLEFVNQRLLNDKNLLILASDGQLSPSELAGRCV